MTSAWHAYYCPDYWRLYDMLLMAAQDFDALEPGVLAMRRTLDEHLRDCKECERMHELIKETK